MSPDPRDPDPRTARPAADTLANGIEARLLAEAVRIHEGTAAPSSPEAAAAEAAARGAGGDLEHRILVRARELDRRLGMASGLGHARAALNLVVAGLLVVAAIAGVIAAQAVMAPGGGNVVNFFAVLSAALGPATAALLLWLIAATMRSARAAGLLGRAAAALAERAVLLTHRDASHIAALRAVGGMMAGGAYGRWTLGAVTHAAWLVFLAALLAMVLLLLSTRSYIFVWETTILSADTYVPLTRWLASVPALFGFSAPDPDDIRASQWLGRGEQAAIARDAWAGLLVGCIVVYGVVPRLVLLAACLLLRARAGRRFRLDTTRPGYARLAPRLMPTAEGMGFADSDAGLEPHRPQRRHDGATERIQPDPLGPVAVLGLEIDVPNTGWPPPFGSGGTLDLGCAQGRQDIREALDALRRTAPPPRLMVLVCSLTTTPDRGLLAQIDAIMAASAIPLVLILTGGQRLRQRATGESAGLRIADWHTLAQEAGIDKERVVELDLDNMTDMSRARLGAIAGESERHQAPADRLERAFAVIRGESARWTAAPDLETQSELHRAIARLYQGGSGRFRLFDPRSLGEGDLVSRVKSGSDLLIDALPGRLALDPRWLTAGALAGALGCVAVASLAVPAAMAGLPFWAGLGAALAAAVRGALRAHGVAEERSLDLADTVKAAALFTLVLDAQGRDEAAITRLLDAAIGDDEAALPSKAAVAEWLDRVRLRYREAERREAGRP